MPALIARGWQAHRATATSLAAIGATAVFGTVRYAFDDLVVWRDAALIGLPGGRRRRLRHDARRSACAARTCSSRSPCVMVVVAAQARLVSHVALALALGLAGGTLAGLFGVGGGIVFVPALTLGLGLSQLSAEATSLAAIVPVVAVGSFRQNRSGLVDWRSAAHHRRPARWSACWSAREIALDLPERRCAARSPLFLVLVGRADGAARARVSCVRSTAHERVRLDPAGGVGRERARDGARRARSASTATTSCWRSRRPSRSASGTPSRAISASRSRRRTSSVLDVSDGPAWARWFSGGRAQPRPRVRRALGRRPGARRRRGDRLRRTRRARPARSPTRSSRARSRAAPRAWRRSACAAATRSRCSCRWRPRS